MVALAVLAAACWWFLLLRTLQARRRMDRLDDLPVAPAEDLPRLSVVLAASNEADALPEALESLLAQDYPDLEVVAVDDRSTDGTGEVLRRFAARDPRLKALEVRHLPPGWLGKIHAQHQGASAATGRLLLFTDADVVFSPGCLTRAAGALLRREAHHMALAPRIVTRGFWENVFVSLFGLVFLTRFPGEKASDPDHPAAVGIGAFNLVQAEAWRSLGGHEALALQVVDDMALALLLKRAGFRTMFALADRWVRVRWVAGLGGILRGLEKNAYAGLDYSPLKTLLTVLVLVGFSAGPAAAVAAGGPASLAGLAALAAMALTSALAAPGMGTGRWAGLFYPLAGPLLALAIARSAVLAEARGAVVWRGTRYPLGDLRRRRIPL